MSDRLNAEKEIAYLIERFDEQKDYYKNSDYNETLTRNELIDPFFYALGWDVYNKNNYAESYREVIHEDKLKIEGTLKAPDYSFRLVGGKRLFFVEAKKPSISVKEGVQPAYQVRRYGWSAKHPISIITDFEEFAVYDCTKKPNPNDKPSVARVKYLTYKEYPQDFDFIWGTFSKEQVLKGSFDKFVQSEAPKVGTATVDKDFLASLDRWRTYLATNISWNNKILTEDEINYVVQQTIDRLLFLRIAEDRRIEPYGSLKHALEYGDYYSNLFLQFKRADDKYNSGLFDFKRDKISESIRIDNKVLKTVIGELYYPECPYEFSVLPIEILGSAYEQFLGKVIRITPAHHAKVEEKPEVRKAGGVYYTPQYIVEFIVKNTVGKLIEGKTPHEITAIKIVDPACGSGSFLIGALQYLLDYHRDYYISNLKHSKGSRDNPMTPDGHLTTAEKKRILLNNIYGVDLDANAVEVTKLSLLLKCLEGETDASINHQLILFNQRVLPSLDNNIKNGNSLIDTDYYDNQFDFGEERRVKPFNWQKTFPEIFQRGGFDAVIGNPPYVRQEVLGKQKEYFLQHYRVYHGMADLYSYFIEKSLSLLNNNGLYGVIVANKWMRANYGEPLRRFIKSYSIYEIIDFGDLPVFESATTYPCIMIIGKHGNSEGKFRLTLPKTLKFSSLAQLVEENQSWLSLDSLMDSGWSLSSDAESRIISKIIGKGRQLGNYVDHKIFRGVLTGLNEAFVIDRGTRDRLIAEDPGSYEIIKPFLTGREIKRFHPLLDKNYLILIPKGFTNARGGNPKDAWGWLQNNYPAIARYLAPFEVKAKRRYDKGDYWWELRSCDYYAEFEKPKIILPEIALRMQASYDDAGIFSGDTSYIIPVDDKFLLGIMNSKVFHFCFSKISSVIRGGYLRFKRQYLERIPIVESVEHRDTLIKYVEMMLQLNLEIKNTELPNHKDYINTKLSHFDTKINEIVYQIYGLTEEEIEIMEGV